MKQRARAACPRTLAMQRSLTQLLRDLHAGLVALSGAAAELAAAMAPTANGRCEFLQRLTANGKKWVRTSGNLKGLAVVSDSVIVMIDDRGVAACDTQSVDADENGFFVKMGDEAAIRKRKNVTPPSPLAVAAHSTAVFVCYGTDYGVQQHTINGTHIDKSPVPLTACPIPGGHTAVGIAVKTVSGHNRIALQHAANPKNESSAHVITGFGDSGVGHSVAQLAKKGVFAFTNRGLVAVVEEGTPCLAVVYPWEVRPGVTIATHQLYGVSAVAAIGFDDDGRLIVLSNLRNAARRTVSWWTTTVAPARMLASLDVSRGQQLGPCMAVHGDGTVAVALECGHPGAGTICVIKL
jgi:hypothetical protein